MPDSSLDPIRSIASKYPEAEKAFLFGDHEVFRERKKVFVWLSTTEKGCAGVSVKLKDSQAAALMLPFVRPSGYGMSKWGWVDAEFPKGKLPLDLLAQWIDESYRHTAPKKLLKGMDSNAPASVPKRHSPPARAQPNRRRASQPARRPRAK